MEKTVQKRLLTTSVGLGSGTVGNVDLFYYYTVVLLKCAENRPAVFQ